MPEDRTISALYAAHRSELVNYANGIVGDRAQAEDVVQEAYLRFGGAAGGHLLQEPLGYLYRIVRNLAIDGLRRRSRERRRFTDDSADASYRVASDRPSPEAELLARDELRVVEAALAELPHATRTALQMHRIDGFKLKDIAQHLGISVSYAHELVAEGIAHCRRRLRTKP